MTPQASLFDQPKTLDQAWTGAQDGMARAELHASPEWKDVAFRVAADLPVGYEFMAEDLVDMVNATGVSTHTAKAIGPVILRLSKRRLIVKVGLRPSRVSHGSAKPVWRRVS